MAKHFEAAPTVPMGDIPAVRGGRIELVGDPHSIFVSGAPQFIGRAPKLCALVVDDASVSAIHAEVRATPEGVRLLDVGSKNGIFVGGNRVVEVYLSTPTEFACGGRLLRFVPLGFIDAELGSGEVTRFGRLVGTAPRMRQAMEQLRKYAATDVSIVITGETGVGKEVAARAVHEASARRGKPFVAINCAAVPDSLLEDVLFGHVKGAFTGADRDRPGLFVEADGGTLLFDEIGEMSAGMQAKLLRAVQEKVVRPLGSSRDRKVDVRILSATHQSLEAKINRGAFRPDLYYRMRQVVVELPALRQRLCDVPMLVEQILIELGRPNLNIDEASIAQLQACSWPGNVRELRHLLEVALAGSPDVLSLDEAFRSTRGLDRRAATGVANAPAQRSDGMKENGAAPESGGGEREDPAGSVTLESLLPAANLMNMTWKEATEELKRRYFTAVWGQLRGNVSQIARQAKVERKFAREALRALRLDVRDGPDDE